MSDPMHPETTVTPDGAAEKDRLLQSDNGSELREQVERAVSRARRTTPDDVVAGQVIRLVREQIACEIEAEHSKRRFGMTVDAAIRLARTGKAEQPINYRGRGA